MTVLSIMTVTLASTALLKPKDHAEKVQWGHQTYAIRPRGTRRGPPYGSVGNESHIAPASGRSRQNLHELSGLDGTSAVKEASSGIMKIFSNQGYGLVSQDLPPTRCKFAIINARNAMRRRMSHSTWKPLNFEGWKKPQPMQPQASEAGPGLVT